MYQKLLHLCTTPKHCKKSQKYAKIIRIKKPQKNKKFIVMAGETAQNQKSERVQKENRLKQAIAECLILDPEDRNFWLNHISVVPEMVLENVTKILESKKKSIDVYINAALEKDPDKKYLSNLKQTILKIKEEAFNIDESSTKKTAEENLKDQLKKLEE